MQQGEKATRIFIRRDRDTGFRMFTVQSPGKQAVGPDSTASVAEMVNKMFVVTCARQVFVTCGTADKRAFLLEAFPTLREDHIGDSRSCAFEEVVKRQTNGAGVHLALNSLADDKLQVSSSHA